jgi:hypothetical protein
MNLTILLAFLRFGIYLDQYGMCSSKNASLIPAFFISISSKTLLASKSSSFK